MILLKLVKTLTKQWQKMTVLILLILLLVFGALPGYITGKWLWKQPFPVKNLQQLKNVHQTGLNLSTYETLEKSQQLIGQHKWSWQSLKKQNTSTVAILLLLPQNGLRDQPEVEWTEVNSWGKWNVAQARSGEFTLTVPDQDQTKKTNKILKVTANFFRGTTKEQTFAVLQWYAMPYGGNASPLNWFISDQLAQWQHQRIPWVAVSILFPIEPFGEIETSWPEIKSLGEEVQLALLKQVFG